MQEEIWKSIPSYEGLYEVSNLGRVRSLGKVFKMNNHGTICDVHFRPQILAQHYAYGYLMVGLNKHKNQKTYLVHRLVAMAFIPNPENKPYINHINAHRDDNRVENLEWCTPLENSRHAQGLGLYEFQGVSKPVAQCDDYGNIIRIFKSSRKAAAYIKKPIECARNIRKVCEKGYGHCGGFCWKWASWKDFEKYKNGDDYVL